MANPALTRHVLAIDATHDLPTQAAAAYRNQQVYPALEASGFGLIRCQGASARRESVAPAARQKKIAYMTGVGHGSYTTYLGDENLRIFQVGTYSPEEADGKIVHFLSCQTARELGPDFVAHGCRAYFGYDETFIFSLEPHLVNLFFECDSEIDIAFAEGLTAAEVYDRVQARYAQRISELEDAGEFYAASMLAYDFEHLCAPSLDSMWGDPHVRM